MYINPLSANPTKWSNILKQFVGKLALNFLSVFGYFVGLALEGLITVLPISVSLDTGSYLNVRKTFRRRPGCLLNTLYERLVYALCPEGREVVIGPRNTTLSHHEDLTNLVFLWCQAIFWQYYLYRLIKQLILHDPVNKFKRKRGLNICPKYFFLSKS